MACTTISPIPLCVSGRPCLVVKNRVKESVKLVQVTPDPNPQCATVASGQDAIFDVVINTGFKVVGVTSSIVYFDNFVIAGDVNTLEIIPLSPSGPSPPQALNCKNYNWLRILIIVAVVGTVLMFMFYLVIPGLPNPRQVTELSSDTYFASISKHDSAKSTFKTVFLVVLLLIGLTASVWCFANGPCSQRATCGECQQRKSLWISAKPDKNESLLNRFICNYLGRCKCESPILEQDCKYYAALSPSESNYEWDANYATKSFKNNRLYNCACCQPGGKKCVDCTTQPCQPCTKST